MREKRRQTKTSECRIFLAISHEIHTQFSLNLWKFKRNRCKREVEKKQRNSKSPYIIAVNTVVYVWHFYNRKFETERIPGLLTCVLCERSMSLIEVTEAFTDQKSMLYVIKYFEQYNIKKKQSLGVVILFFIKAL